MLWIEKYRPKSFEEITTHKEVVSMLESYTLENIPNLIIHGQPGHNKKSLLYSLISHLYGKYPVLQQKNTEIEAGSSKINVNYAECDEMIEINPSEYGTRDRHVVQSVIKEMAQTKPIMSFFTPKKSSIKVIVIDCAEYLSKDAQAALRRTMEIYSSHFRIFMVCTELSKLIEPIRSRCLFVRVRGFLDDEILNICESVAKKEGYSVSHNTLKSIASNSSGDCRKALCMLEIHCINTLKIDNDGNNAKKLKTDTCDSKTSFKLDWELKIDSIAHLIIHSPKPETMTELRKEFYALINSNVAPDVIILELLKSLQKNSFETNKALCAFALGYDERIRLGNKPLYHLEAFAASAMCLFSMKK